MLKVVVLAAGVGKRLQPLTRKIPKSLIKIGNKTLLERNLAILNEYGFKDIVIVVGHFSNLLKKTIGSCYMGMKIRYIYNRRFRNSGSAYSLWLAKNEFYGKPFILMDADLLMHKKILGRLLDSPYEDCLVLDKNFVDTGEEVKVVAKDYIVKALGKKVNKKRGEIVGEVIGLYKFSNKTTKILGRSLSYFLQRYGIESEYEDVINYMLPKCKVYYIDVENLPWIEIDFIEDLLKAKKMYAELINRN